MLTFAEIAEREVRRRWPHAHAIRLDLVEIEGDTVHVHVACRVVEASAVLVTLKTTITPS